MRFAASQAIAQDFIPLFPSYSTTQNGGYTVWETLTGRIAVERKSRQSNSMDFKLMRGVRLG